LPFLVPIHDTSFSSTVLVILATLAPQEVDVDEDREAVDFLLKTTVDKKGVVDKLGLHLQLRMDAHTSFPEAAVTHLHSRFHNGTYLGSPT